MINQINKRQMSNQSANLHSDISLQDYLNGIVTKVFRGAPRILLSYPVNLRCIVIRNTTIISELTDKPCHLVVVRQVNISGLVHPF